MPMISLVFCVQEYIKEKSIPHFSRFVKRLLKLDTDLTVVV